MLWAMRPSLPALAAVACILFSSSLALAGAVDESDSRLAVGDLGWIAGHWLGGDDGTRIEEVWTVPADGNMMGMFRMISEGELRFCEFMSIELGSEGPVLRIKHFGAGLKGREERDESIVFDLRTSEPGRAVFETTKDGNPERLIFVRTEHQLEITLEKPQENSQLRFHFHKVDP